MRNGRAVGKVCTMRFRSKQTAKNNKPLAGKFKHEWDFLPEKPGLSSMTNISQTKGFGKGGCVRDADASICII